VRLSVVSLVLAGCAAPVAVAPAPVGHTREEWGACADSSCCDAIQQRLGAARAAQDDHTADEEVQRLALACPERTAGLFDRWSDEDMKRCPKELTRAAAIGVEYDIHVATADVLLWAAVYFDRARYGLYRDSDARELVMTFDVRSGAGPTQGRVVRVEKRQPAALAPGDWGTVLVTLARQEGPEPFRLEAVLTRQARKLVLTECPRREGTIGMGGNAPRRTAEPPAFVPPPELKNAGRSHLSARNCPKPQGGKIIHLPSLHPRRTAAALDWLRRFDYVAGSPCDLQTVEFSP
jgi:hypothetical protein